MIDNLQNLDIINSSVGSTDFLCQNAPLVGTVELNRSSDRRRIRGFLLEGKLMLKLENKYGKVCGVCKKFKDRSAFV